MGYRPYPAASPLLFGYDPSRDLPADHLARLVDSVVEEAVSPPLRPRRPGQPPFDPRLGLKVLLYGYATGIRSSRQLERLCHESLPYLFLTRGDAPSYRTLCHLRLRQRDLLEQVWLGLFAVALAAGMKRLGHIVLDSTKLRANASNEAVLSAAEFAPVRAELLRILTEAEALDAREEEAGPPGQTRLGTPVDPEQMRSVLRRVRRQLAKAKRTASPDPGEARGGSPPTEAAAASAAPEPTAPAEAEPKAAAATPSAPPEPERRCPRPLTARMRQRLAAAVLAIEQAMAAGEKHLCLTDPEARMMGEGRSKKIQECHSFEVAVDREAGLLVAAQTSGEASDQARLEPLVAAAALQEPGGVKQVDADSGYFSGGAVGRLIRSGIDTCIPDSSTAADLYRGQPIGTVRASARGEVSFTYEPETDCYRCPAGNELRRRQTRVEGGQAITEYRAWRACRGCPLATSCLSQKQAVYRTLKVSEYQEELTAARERFATAAQQARYRHRGEVVETVFGFVRGVWQYTRWLLRGREGVACEGQLFRIAYQLRKLHSQWQPT